MTRIAALASAALALALSVSLDRAVVVAGTDRTEVVVLLDSPPLSNAPESAAAIAAEQREFRRELEKRVPSARVGWRYRLVANGFSVSVPSAQVPRLATLRGVRDVLPSATYGPQLDRTPGQIGAPVIWGPTLDTQGQGMKIGILDTGVDPSHPFFDPAGYAMPPGFPKGQQRFTSAKVIVARARRIQLFLSQPFFVAEQFTGIPGKYTPRDETIASFRALCDGEYDHLPEQAFLLVGGIEEAVEAAKKMEQAA